MIRLLTALAVIAALAACGSTPRAAAPDIEVRDAFATEGTTALAVYLRVDNAGGADEIVGAVVDDPDLVVDRITLHRSEERDGLSIMAPTEEIDVAGESSDAVTPESAHLMLEGVDAAVAAGEEIDLRLDLRRSADIAITARVVTADEAIGLLTEGSA